MFIVFRFLSNIPIPGIDTFQLEGFLSQNQFLGVLNIFSGGGLSNMSIAMLGVGPYITASIVMQLLTMMSSRLKALYHEEGEIGRKKFVNISRYLTIPLAIIQGFSLIAYLRSQGILQVTSFTDLILPITIVVAGSVLLTWIGELITEYGIGNGLSIIIFAGIVASLPAQISQLAFTFTKAQIPIYIAFVVVAIIIIAGVVMVSEAERPVPMTYAKTVRGSNSYGGGSTYLPLRVNQAGVMPIIFALSIMLFPQMLATILSQVSSNAFFTSLAGWINTFLQTQWLYALVYFVLVVVFTYFYTAITFDPDAMATNLQKNGAFIPGIRPGNSTSEYVGGIVGRITFFGGLFLGVIAVLPIIMQQISGIQSLAIGGTALLIVVSVVLDIMKKVDAQITMREY